MLKSLKKLSKDNRGQALAEYALILALIAVVVIVAITALGGKLSSVFDTITAAIPG